MANIAGSYDPNAAPSEDFSPVPAGDYAAEIIDSAVEEISRQSAKGRCLKLVWKVQGGEFDGRQIWQRINLWPENMNNVQKVIEIANSQFSSIRMATGVQFPNDTSELHHRPCLLRVTVRVDPNGQYAPQNEVKSVAALNAAPASAPAAAPAAAQAPAQRNPPAQTPPPAAQRAAAPQGQQRPWR
jgi:hypothetical protein